MRPLLLCSSALLACSALLAGCNDASSALNEPSAIAVRATPVQSSENASAALRFSGIVQAQQRATLTFQVSGALRKRHVELGQAVNAGQLLAEVYNPVLTPALASAQARLNELQTQLEQAERERQRLHDLFQRGAVSEQEMEQVTARQESLQASVATARAGLQEARQMRDESRLLAPFAGRIERIMVEQDEFVSAGQPVLRMSSPQQREVEVRVPVHLISALSVGQSVPVWQVSYRQQPPIDGVISEIAQSGAVRGELQGVRVSFAADSAPAPGEPVEVGLPMPVSDALQVPILALMRNELGTSVFRVNDASVERVPVEVVQILGEMVLVQGASLAAGDQVVYAGLTRLTPGDRVELLP